MPVTLTDMQKSALREAGNIGSGHAAIALSQLMGKKIMIAVPSVDVFELPRLNKVLGAGGRMWVESEPGKGSAFKFTLPVG